MCLMNVIIIISCLDSNSQKNCVCVWGGGGGGVWEKVTSGKFY